MDQANFELNMKQINPWGNLSAGAKVATVVAALAIGAASVAASIFFAGAALFAGAVFVIYRWASGLFGRGKAGDDTVVAEYTEVTPKPAES